MRYEKDHIRIALRWLVAIIVGLLICLIISSCKTRYITTEVPVTIHDSIRVVQTERVTDTIRETNIISLIDTMWLDTSTVATLGMPVLHHERNTNVSHSKEQKSNKETADTVYIEKEKPVIVTNTEIKEVNKLHWWQSALMWLGGILSVGLASIIIFIFWRIRH